MGLRLPRLWSLRLARLPGDRGHLLRAWQWWLKNRAAFKSDLADFLAHPGFWVEMAGPPKVGKRWT